MGGTAADIAALLCGKLPFMAGVSFTPEIARVLNSKKVSDHHAIIPTMELAKTDLATLPESEKNILTPLRGRVCSLPPPSRTPTKPLQRFSPAPEPILPRGEKTILSDGWKDLERCYRATLKTKPEADDGDSDASTLPELSEGQTFSDFSAKVTEHDTTPPKPHNEASLLSAMERAGNEDTDPDAERRGLGTPPPAPLSLKNW